MENSIASEKSIKIRKSSIENLSNLNAKSNKIFNSAKKGDSSRNDIIKQIIIKDPANDNNPINKKNSFKSIDKINKFSVYKKLEKFPILGKNLPKNKEFKKMKSMVPITSNLPKLKNQFSLNNINQSLSSKNIIREKNKSYRKINSYSGMIKKDGDNIYNLRKIKSLKICNKPYSAQKKLSQFSDFYKKSKNEDVSARNIYDYYIGQESINKIKPISNFTKFIEKKYKIPKNRFKKIYCLDNEYLQRLKEMKCNKYIAFKKDFEIKEYQNALLEILSSKLDRERLYCLQQDFQKFNEKIERGCVSPKGRFSFLADKINNHAPLYLINKLKKMDQENLKAKAKRYNLRSRSMDENGNFYINSSSNGKNNLSLPILNKRKG